MTLRSRIPASARLRVRGIGRRRQRQDVDLAAELLQPFLRRDPEPLLLVDDDQPEIAEPDVLAEEPVGADDDVDGAIGETRDRRRLRRRRHEPRQQPDLQREGREPLRERREVLGGEDRGRNEDRHLPAVLGRLERCRGARPRSCP